MESQAKSKLSKTIRTLREELLLGLRNSLESAYLLKISVEDAGLPERRRVRRERVESWIEEQTRSLGKKEQKGARERFLQEVVKEAAYTWLNRLVVLRLLEANGHTKEEALTGGWSSSGQKRFRQAAYTLSKHSESEGYATLLQLVFDDLAVQMPGLFGDVGLVKLVPMPPSLLRKLVEALNDTDLDSCWKDNTTLGWVYQYWNDPEREGLDAKLNSGGKVENHEIASKTQLFTEQYMVEWLLQNSLNQTWLAICSKNGWTPECQSDGVLDRLESRREEWREKREAGEVGLEELMPIHGDAEEQWKYWVPQPLPREVVQSAPDSIRGLKLLDPACGSGHFLVGAFELLMAFYKEEARHRNERWSETQIATWIIEDNIHGIDIDPRAVQIAAAALMLAARNACGERLEVSRINLVAPTLRLASLPEDDDAIVELKATIHQETGLAPELTQRLLTALAGADHLGTLLRIDEAITDVLKEHIGDGQVGLFDGGASVGLEETSDAMREAILSRIQDFLDKHAASDDLGLRLRGEMLATGVRFLELMKEDHYDVVVGNPPYQGTSKMKQKNYFKKHYPRGKADLFACFLERGLELAKQGGVSAMVTMRNWMFIRQFQDLREFLIGTYDLRALGDFDRGAFEEIPDEVVSVALSVFWRRSPDHIENIAIQPTPLDDTTRDSLRTHRKRAAVLCHIGRFEFQTDALKGIEGWPLVYWWDISFLKKYLDAPKLSDVGKVKQGISTANDTRFVRRPWEVNLDLDFSNKLSYWNNPHRLPYAPLVKGAEGKQWIEPLSYILGWFPAGLAIRINSGSAFRSPDVHFKLGVSYSGIGAEFRSRVHLYSSVCQNMGSAMYCDDNELDLMLSSNSIFSKKILQSLNPGIHFEVGDVKKLPVVQVNGSELIVDKIFVSFNKDSLARETSVEFKRPAPSCWEYAQEWAQVAVDRDEGEPLPDWEPEYEDPMPEQWVSWGVGVALGRFDKEEGLVEEVPEGALPAGILFLSDATEEDSLEDEACELLREQWDEHGAAINKANSTKSKEDLRTWLRKRFFADVHRQMYENAPIYFPLSSAKKSFVAYVSIHRWDADTLRILQADHLLPERQRIEGRIDDLRATPEEERNRQDQKQLDNLLSFLDELEDFITLVEQCAEQGPPAPDSKTPEREVDARYEPVLDDGTMINAAGLWPLLDPVWKSYPKKWWKNLAKGTGRNDYDWSKLAARYFPTRVDEKCKEDPSLAVAHGCFWKYHPERAYAWELRLQHEIEEDFTLDEEDSDDLRDAFLTANPEKAQEIREDELARRLRAAKKNDEDVDEDELREQLGIDFDDEDEEDE